MPIFEGSRSKIARAKDHLQELELNFQGFSDSKPYKLKQEHDSETEEYILVYYPIGAIPSNWSVIIGEFFYHLRSALDLAIYELTVSKNGASLKGTEFPVFEDKSLFSERKNNGQPTNKSGLYKIRGLGQKTIDCIEALQPYNVRQEGQEPILSLLHEMNIIDKHRELHLCRRMALSTKLMAVRDIPDFVSWGLEIGENLDDRAVIARLKLARKLDDTVYIDANVVIDIAFDQRSSSFFKKQERVITVMESMIAGVEKILSLLEDSLN